MTEGDFGERERAELDCWLAEFKCLRDEIGNRTRYWTIALLGGIAAIGTILSAYLAAQNPSPSILLSLSIILPLLGFYTQDHRLMIGDIGTYIEKRIATGLRALVQNEEVLRWETFTRNEGTKARQTAYVLGYEMPLALPSVAILVGNLRIVKHWVSPEVWLWLAGAILTAVWLGFMSYHFKYWFRLGEKPEKN